MRRVLSILAASAFASLANAASAEPPAPSPLQALVSADETQKFDAVGRLNFGRSSFCTGTLIGPRLVLTAAHCLFDKITGAPFEASDVEFLAGWREGRAAAYRKARRIMAHPAYAYGASDMKRIATDLALIELARPIRAAEIAAFETRARPPRGAEVGVLSYARDRANAPSLQKPCHVLDRQSGVLVLTCDVDFGSSGAPVLSFENGKPRIVSVVSAKAEIEGGKVAIGTSLEAPLAELLALMGKGDGVFHRTASNLHESDDSGAKFVRP